ncbi:hypothetical protein ACTMTI_14135 [Nonomuraea sp. H19]|uniref:hypothetical protein n=1 Tax=Nonomuraea sp. H19 TaxID=3452206 RepID=UPI003F8A2F44
MSSDDQLKVPSQRADETASLRRDDEPEERPRGDLADDEEYTPGGPTSAGEPRSPRADDEYAAAVPGAVIPPAPGDEEVPHRDPYARTGGDMLAEPEPGPQTGPDPIRGSDTSSEKAPDTSSEEAPAHAAPKEIVVLFDQDPAQVQARWRDLQASFVDDPGEAVQRADGLVGEVVDALTSSLTSRTDALRDRWKDAESADTEQLRLALRDYRNVLERLLALSSQRD